MNEVSGADPHLLESSMNRSIKHDDEIATEEKMVQSTLNSMCE